MITLQELCRYLEDLLQSSSMEDYGPNGLQVEGKNEIMKIATAVSSSMSTIEKAVDLNVDALIVHHGMFWNKDNPCVVGTKRNKLQMLLENDINLLGYHLPLDCHQDLGNNWKAAKDMGWENLLPFGEYNGLYVGVRGTVKDVPIEDFVRKLEEYYQHQAFVAPGGGKYIKNVAITSGGGHQLIFEAAKEKVDCYITGSFDEYVWNVAHEEKINFCALGHSATEIVGPQALGEHLSQKFNLEHHFISTNNPF